MLITDIDNFKAINAQFGHICGDHVLKTIADTMNRLAPENMETGRIGGDEFMALFSGGQGKEIIKNYARQLLEEMCIRDRKNCWSRQRKKAFRSPM